ncbi:MAG TPA: hypothetical protein VHY19_15540 [Steroidobacteraceae bacterium]|jgi:hypothetical protein|nr:hypothetical protein [Steroidobacteraceae bacterium]
MNSREPPAGLLWAALGAVVIGGVGLALRSRRPAARLPRLPRLMSLAPGGRSPTVRAARRLNRAAGLLATSVLADSAVEHYRGSFHNRAMIAPLISGGLSLAVSLHGHADKRAAAHSVRDTIYAIAMLTGLTGTVFHLYNVGNKPGGFRWENLFYGAPLGAPAALLLSGGTGYLAERVRDTPRGRSPRIAGLPAGRTIAAATALGLLGTVAEAALLHFRGAFNDPFMFAPVTLPPLSALCLANAAFGPRRRERRLTRALLRLTAWLGLAGVAFHLRGIQRQMGGWHNLGQNVPNGPPIPAPPSFSGLAFAALAALGLMEDHPDG